LYEHRLPNGRGSAWGIGALPSRDREGVGAFLGLFK
jgi:hypothetical protein